MFCFCTRPQGIYFVDEPRSSLRMCWPRHLSYGSRFRPMKSSFDATAEEFQSQDSTPEVKPLDLWSSTWATRTQWG
jgi:hypothetical protein